MKELPLSKVYQFIEPGPVLLVATSDHGKPNLMAMSYHMVIEDEGIPLIGCILGPWDHSFETLRKTRECVLAVPTVDLASKVVEIGNCSGIDTDKFKTFSLTPVSAEKVKAPLVAECLVNLECRIADDSLIDKYNLIILEVVKAWIDPERKERRLIHHNGNGTFTVDGETLDLRDKMVRWSSYTQR
ncbi:flavin reductase family protein [Calorimonas adulescens]|jgi:Flavin reductase like domain.|uniref:Flavin reductase family protein n=1 Tax=Calorimonas adulescens TaxID=2606906 RepID=A0A5D8QDB9_9THEO|nr:flavin reductase family protein [Calorimonas adulescens]TZE81348.1 flavin reductase family protein [Calorimonas adulescens]